MDIKTERLIIRRFTSRDLSLIFEINNHPECIRFNGWDSMSIEDCQKVLDKWILDSETFLEYGVFCVPDHNENPLGMTFIMKYEDTNDYEIGFRLKRSAWNNGYAREITESWISYGKSLLNASSICAEVDGENTRSLNIFRKLDFEEMPHPAGGNGKLFIYKI